MSAGSVGIGKVGSRRLGNRKNLHLAKIGTPQNRHAENSALGKLGTQQLGIWKTRQSARLRLHAANSAALQLHCQASLLVCRRCSDFATGGGSVNGFIGPHRRVGQPPLAIFQMCSPLDYCNLTFPHFYVNTLHLQ